MELLKEFVNENKTVKTKVFKRKGFDEYIIKKTWVDDNSNAGEYDIEFDNNKLVITKDNNDWGEPDTITPMEVIYLMKDIILASDNSEEKLLLDIFKSDK